MIVVIDNFDSFTYNLVQLAYQFDENILVFRNDCITPQEIDELHPDSIIISPGPCYPHDAGISEEVIQKAWRSVQNFGCVLGASSNLWSLWGKNYSCKKTDAWKAE